MAKKGDEKQRVQIRLSGENAKRLQDVADRYGMTVNSLVSFIVGQWLDSNYDLKEYTRENILPMMAERSENMIGKIDPNSPIIGMMEKVMREVVESQMKK